MFKAHVRFMRSFLIQITQSPMMGRKHAYILCEHENGLAILDYISKYKLAPSEWDKPPGSSIAQLFAGESVKLLLRKLARLFFSLHGYCKRTLRCNFTLENIWVNESGEIKLHNIELVEATGDRIMSAYKRLAKQLREELFHNEIPPEIEQWFILMESGDLSVEELIVVFPGIMAERNQLELFMRIYKHLSPLKARNRPLYDKLLAGLPYAKWELLVELNNYMNEVYCHVDKYGNRTVYEKGAPGLNQYLKNCESHLHEKALNVGIQLPRFSTWHIPRMIRGIIPLYLGDLAENLYRYGELMGLRPQDLMG